MGQAWASCVTCNLQVLSSLLLVRLTYSCARFRAILLIFLTASQPGCIIGLKGMHWGARPVLLPSKHTPGPYSKGSCPCAQHVGHEGPGVFMQPPGAQHTQVGQASHGQACAQVQELNLAQHAHISSLLHAPHRTNLIASRLYTANLPPIDSHA